MDNQSISVKKTQVDASHYLFENYVDFGHWQSYYNQINECISSAKDGSRIVVIGKGDNIVPLVIGQIIENSQITVVDYARDLNPDICCDILELSENYGKKQADIVLCCQVLEHLEFGTFDLCLNELFTILKPGGILILSLPDGGILFKINISIPKIKINIRKKICRFYKKDHMFKGQHYWEINSARPYILGKVRKQIEKYFKIQKEYLTWNYEFHRFFVCKKGSV